MAKKNQKFLISCRRRLAHLGTISLKFTSNLLFEGHKHISLKTFSSQNNTYEKKKRNREHVYDKMNDIQFIEKLANAVQQYPCLYDKTCKDFKDKNVKTNGWNEVARTVNLEEGK